MAHAHIHILGSRAGYTTLDATPGVTTAERAELEVLSFGDATNAEAMTRLETHASMIGRRLRSGRFAISRMLPGGTDDAGRPTIEVVSLLVDLASYTAILGALARLASDARLWRVARGAVSRGFEVPEEPVQITASDPRVLRAFDAWIAAHRQGATAVLGAGDEHALLAMVALLDADDLAACRWGVGVLSLSAPVDVCTLAPTTAAIGPRPVLRASTSHAQPWLNPEMAAAEEHASRNPLLPPSASLAQAVRIEPAFDRPARATPAWDAEPVGHEPQPRRKSLLPIAAVSAACSLALLAVMAVAYARGGRRDADLVATTDRGLDEDPPLVQSVDAARVTSLGYEGFPAAAPPREPESNQPAQSPTESTSPGPTPPPAPSPPSDCPQGQERKPYFDDLDGDGVGAGPEVGRACVGPGAQLPPGKSDEGHDECPNNNLYVDDQPCGCDWWEPLADKDGDGTSECAEDDDGDGIPNYSDDVDDRKVAVERAMDQFRAARTHAESAGDSYAKARDGMSIESPPERDAVIASSLRKGGYAIEDTVGAVAAARQALRFGRVPGATKLSSAMDCEADLIEDDFKDFLEVLRLLDQIDEDVKKLNSRLKDEIDFPAALKDVPERLMAPDLPIEVVRWSCDLIHTKRLREGQRDWVFDLPDKRATPFNRGKKAP